MQALPAHIITPFDLHVLGTPPAFILSQDQTLMLKWCLCPASFIWHCLLLIRVACQSFDQLACSWISLKILKFSGLHYCLFVKDQNLLLRKSCVALLLFSATALIVYHNRFCLSTTFFKYFWHLTTADGEGGIWTLAPLLTTCTLSRGVPSASWVLLQSPDAWTSVNIILSSASLLLVQRREWDSNPRALADKRFSRPPRYDHFDISPQTCFAILSKLFVFVKNFFEVFHRMFRSFSFVTRDIDEF